MDREREHRLDDRQLESLVEAWEGAELEAGVPGKQTRTELVGQMVAAMYRPSIESRSTHSPAVVRSAMALGNTGRSNVAPGRCLPVVPRTCFDDFRALALRDVLARLGNRPALRDATLVAAEPRVARRVAGERSTPDQGVRSWIENPEGRGMWRVAERRAVTLYRRALATGTAALETPAVTAALRSIGSGNPLDPRVCRKMEHLLGVCLDRVRLHTGAVAHGAAEAANAKAFTVGEDIFFPGYDPQSAACEETLLHELVHCCQWWQGRIGPNSGGVAVSETSHPLEQEAETIVARALRGPTGRRPTDWSRSAVTGWSEVPVLRSVQPAPIRPGAPGGSLTPDRPVAAASPVNDGGHASPPHLILRKAAEGRAQTSAADVTAESALRGSPGNADHRDAAPGNPVTGFIDHRDGAMVYSDPSKRGRSIGRLAAATRVFLRGSATADWIAITAGNAHGYVEKFRVATQKPEPEAWLYQVTSGDTAEKLVAKHYGQLARRGRDLRFYENVLWHANKGRKGIRGAPQDPDMFGKGANNLQLVEGERIWLVSPGYAETLAAAVPSGSYTGGALAAITSMHAWYQGHVYGLVYSVVDVFRSMKVTQAQIEEVGRDYVQFLSDNKVEIGLVFAAFLTAEVTSGLLAKSDKPTHKLAGGAIQLLLSGFGVAGVSVSIDSMRAHAERWLHLAWTASSEPATREHQIDDASKEYLRMWVSFLMACLAAGVALRSLASGLKLFSSPGRISAPVKAALDDPAVLPTVQRRDGSYSVPAANRTSAVPSVNQAPALETIPLKPARGYDDATAVKSRAPAPLHPHTAQLAQALAMDQISEAEHRFLLKKTNEISRLPEATNLMPFRGGTPGTSGALLFRCRWNGEDAIVKVPLFNANDPGKAMDDVLRPLGDLAAFRDGPRWHQRVRVFDEKAQIWREGVVMERFRNSYSVQELTETMEHGKPLPMVITPAHVEALLAFRDKLIAKHALPADAHGGNFLVRAPDDKDSRLLLPIDIKISHVGREARSSLLAETIRNLIRLEQYCRSPDAVQAAAAQPK